MSGKKELLLNYAGQSARGIRFDINFSTGPATGQLRIFLQSIMSSARLLANRALCDYGLIVKLWVGFPGLFLGFLPAGGSQ